MALKLLPEDLSDVPAHLADRYEAQAGRYWDIFYRRNTNKFFKDRHYLHKEFPALAAGPATLLEVGCGVGNTVFPLLEINPALHIHCCDFAPSAIELVRQNPQYGASGGAVHAFVADITCDKLAGEEGAGGCGVPLGGCDLATMIFVLSAIHPHRMAAAVHNVAACLRPGSGRLLFRDYAEGDLAQERLAGGGVPKRLGPNFYVRGDGTRCYYFRQSEVLSLFSAAGFHCDSLTLHERTVVNHKRDIAMDRRWLQAIFTLRQPLPPPLPLRDLLAQRLPSGTAAQHVAALEPWQLPQQQQQQGGQDEGWGQQQGGQEEGVAVVTGGYEGEEHPAGVCMEVDDDGAGGDIDGGSGGRGVGVGMQSSTAVPALSTPPAAPPSSCLLGGGGSWLTGAAGRLASHLAAGPGVPSGRALLPDSLDAADEAAAELSPSPRHTTSASPTLTAHNHHSPQHPHTHPQLHPYQQYHQQQQHLHRQPHPASTSIPGGGSFDLNAPAPTPPLWQHHGSSSPAHRSYQQAQDQLLRSGGAGGGSSGLSRLSMQGPGASGDGGGADDIMEEGEGPGRGIETELEAEFFATIGRDTAEVVAEEVAAAGAALSRVRLLDVADVAAARFAAAAAAAATTASSTTYATASAHHHHQPPLPPVPHLQPPGPQGPVGSSSGVVDVLVAGGLGFRLLCGLDQTGSPQVPPVTLALSRLLAASHRLISGKVLLQLGAATALTMAPSQPGSVATAAAATSLPAMAAVRHGSARRVVISEPGREGLTAAAADVRRNAHSLVVERLRLAPLDWTQLDGTSGSSSAASLSGGGAGYTYVSSSVRQARDVLQLQPGGYDIVYGADLLSAIIPPAAAAEAGESTACVITAARGLFEASSQLLKPTIPTTSTTTTTAISSNPSMVISACSSAGRTDGGGESGGLLLLVFSGAWAAAHGLGFAGLAAVCGWELLTPDQLTNLYGIASDALAAVGSAVMGFRRRVRSQ